MSAAPVRLGAGEPGPFVADRVEAELSSLWKSAGVDGDGGVFRACRGTLVLPLAAGEDPAELIDPLSERFPARFLVIRETGGDGLIATTSASCRLDSEGASLVCSEVVLLEGSSRAGAAVASAVRSLAVGDLPRAVLGDRRPLSSHPWAKELGREVDVIVGDTTEGDAAEAVSFWDHALHGDHPLYADVTWVRLACWRRLLAARWRPGDREPRTVTVRGRTDPAGRNAASLLGGWLRDRLGGTASVRLEDARPADGLFVSVTVEGNGWRLSAEEDHPLVRHDRSRERADRLAAVLAHRAVDAVYRGALARRARVETA